MCIVIGELVSSWGPVGVVEFFTSGCIVYIGHIWSECCVLTQSEGVTTWKPCTKLVLGTELDLNQVQSLANIHL